MTTATRYPVLSASSLSGDSVKNRQGDKLGQIKDLMIDTGTGHIAYAVLDFGGFLGMGNKLFAVPWGAFALDTEDKCLMLDVSKELLESTDGFDKDDWPDMTDRSWGERVHTHFGVPPYWV